MRAIDGFRPRAGSIMTDRELGQLRYAHGRAIRHPSSAGVTWPGGASANLKCARVPFARMPVTGCLLFAKPVQHGAAPRRAAAEAILDAALADGHAHNDMWWQPE